jgi:hypothetical protein
MACPQHHNHYTDDSSRKTCKTPKNVDSWFEDTEEMAVVRKGGRHSQRGVPELKDTDGHVEREKVERLLIAVTDAGLRPNAVVIQFVYTFSAATAVGHPWYFVVVTFLTIFLVEVVVRDSFLLLQFINITADAHSLNVAPETHKDVKKCKVAHDVSFGVREERVEVLNERTGTWVYR